MESKGSLLVREKSPEQREQINASWGLFVRYWIVFLGIETIDGSDFEYR